MSELTYRPNVGAVLFNCHRGCPLGEASVRDANWVAHSVSRTVRFLPCPRRPSTQITLSQNVNGTQTGELLTFWQTQITGNVVSGSPTVTGIASTTGLLAGMGVAASGVIPFGSTISSVDSSTRITLSNAAAASVSSAPLEIYPAELTGNTTTGSAEITAIPTTLGLAPGMVVMGAGIPPGSTISTVDSATQVTLVNSATATGTGVPIQVAATGPVDNVRVAQQPSGVYVIGTGWGGAARGMIERHRKLLRQNMRLPGMSPGSEPVLGEGLAMIGYTWLAEYTMAQQMTGELAGVTDTYLHAVGIIGMKAVGSSQGPYVDLPLNTVGTVQRVSRVSPQALPITPMESSAFFTAATVSSVLESGTIEQTQPGATAASTIKVLDQWSSGGTIFDMNDPAVSGDNCAYYANNIRGQLAPVNPQTTPDLLRIDSLVGYSSTTQSCLSPASTTQVIAPSNLANTIDQWSGTGYLQILYNATRTSVTGIGAIITGGLSGGEPASPVPAPQVNSNQASGAVDLATGAQTSPPSQQAASNTSDQATNIAAAGGGTAAVTPNGGDPVDLVTGSYIYSHQDLSVGSGPFPFSLPLVRSFDSGSAQAGTNSSLLGNGWMHNYDITALVDSDGFVGMGETSPINGAPAIAAIYVLQDILNQQTGGGQPTKSADRIVVAAMTEKWLMDQLTNNTVSVTQAGSIEEFTLLPNGSYHAPLGSADTLTGSLGGPYTYRGANGVTLAFNSSSVVAAGKVATLQNAGGAMLNFVYNSSGQLQSVINPSIQRQLNFHYTNAQLTSVDDNTGPSPRSISFGYDSSNDLTSYVDPLGQTTTFVYPAPGQLGQIFYPSHPGQPFVTMTYDTLGRPAQQIDANGNTTILHFAGTRTEIDDPAGTARVSYFNPRGKTLDTIDGLGSATIDAGAGALTAYTYDGLDRVLTMMLPEGNSQSFTYDANSNPLTVTQTPKPGSPLSPLLTSFTYISPVIALPNFEEVQTATDPLRLVTAYSYDTSGNRISIVADAGTGHFNATTGFTYDTQGRVLTATNPVGMVTQNTYDATGDLISTVADYGSDCGGTQQVHICQTTLFAYDAFGNVVSTTDLDGNITASTFDADRRLTSLTLPPVSGTLLTTYAYDPDGRLLQTQQSSAGSVLRTTSATYTLTGKLATSTDANGNTTRYAYDNVDRVSQVTDAAGRATAFSYDPLSRPYQTLNLAVQAQPLLQYGYTLNGKLASLTDGHTPTGNTTSFVYDGFDRLSTTTYADASTEVLGYDADSNVLTRQTRAGATITFTYDTLNRLSTKAGPSEPTVTYTYDLAGRTTGISDNSAALPALPSGPATYSVSYAYDARNRLTGATWPNVPAAVTAAASSVTFVHSRLRSDEPANKPGHER